MINLYTTISILSALVLLVTAVDCASNQLIPQSTRQRTIAVCILIGIALVSEVAFTLLDFSSFFLLVLLRRVLKALEFSVTPYIGVTVAMAYGDPPRPKAAVCAAFLHFLFQWVAVFFGWVFRLDAVHGYQRGILFPVYLAAISLSFLYAFWAVVRNGKNYQVGTDTVMVLVSVLLIVGVASVYLIPDMRDTYLCIALGNLVVYFRYYKIMLQVDAVTGLLNRRCYDVNVSNLGSRAMILFFDVDQFKIVNDTYGHKVGDICLKCSATILREVYGSSGLCYRIGGDEFCVILTQNLECADEMNRQFREKLQALRQDDPRMPGLSMGYAFYDAASSNTESVIEEADNMLYENKKAAFGGKK